MLKCTFRGVSTRKIAKITEELCGFEISGSEVSRTATALDEELEKWRNRALGSFPFVFLDARKDTTGWCGREYGGFSRYRD